MRFTRGYPDTVRDSLVKARVEVVSRMVELANREQCDLFAIAGDLFDNLKVSKTAIRETAHALKRFEGLVAVLPGNHDYLQEADDPIWPNFADQLGDDHLVLKDRRPYDLGPFELPCVLYPGVCCSKHSKENAIGWVPEATA
ncbi:MAG: metallophosphoesterase, partial [Fuerstiella sp.]